MNFPRTCKYLGSHLFTNHLGHLEGEQPYLGDLLAMVINHLLSGMILQAYRYSSFFVGSSHPTFLAEFLTHLSYNLNGDQNPDYLLYTGDYITQLYSDYKDPVMESQPIYIYIYIYKLPFKWVTGVLTLPIGAPCHSIFNDRLRRPTLSDDSWFMSLLVGRFSRLQWPGFSCWMFGHCDIFKGSPLWKAKLFRWRWWRVFLGGDSTGGMAGNQI